MNDETKRKSADLVSKPEHRVRANSRPAGAASYRPTAEEAAVICKMAQQLEAKTPVPGLKLSDDGMQVSVNHPNGLVGMTLFMNAIGTENPAFANGLMCHLAQISLTEREKTDDRLNFAFSAVAGDQPTDQDEAMLGVLKAASYLCAVKTAAHYQNAETRMEADAAQTAFNKLARTFVILSEALMRKCSSSEQKVVVQNNVAVNDNGQAVIGNVNGPQIKTPAKEQ
jgi:hypothetical protein